MRTMHGHRVEECDSDDSGGGCDVFKLVPQDSSDTNTQTPVLTPKLPKHYSDKLDRAKRMTKCTLDEEIVSDSWVEKKEDIFSRNRKIPILSQIPTFNTEQLSSQIPTFKKHSNFSNSNNVNTLQKEMLSTSASQRSSKSSSKRSNGINTTFSTTISANVSSTRKNYPETVIHSELTSSNRGPEITISKRRSFKRSNNRLEIPKTTAFEATLSPVAQRSPNSSTNSSDVSGGHMNLPKTKSLESMISILNHSLRTAGLTGNVNSEESSSGERENGEEENRGKEAKNRSQRRKEAKEENDLNNGIIYESLLRVMNQGDLKIGRRCQEALIEGRRCSEITDCLHGKPGARNVLDK